MKITERVKAQLSDDLRQEKYQGNPNKYAGHCYIASEAIYHLGAKNAGYKPHVMKVDGETHWFLKNPDKPDWIIDATREQFDKELDYSLGHALLPRLEY